MANITILPAVVQNKIAAGEVVERPASAVKELVENAIDAGADSITVEIEEGGAQLIRVTDNGSGMDGVNLALAVERHATSKIRDIDDIFHISTLGFRGEALPSIGSVAHLTISTGQKGAAEGASLTVNGGEKQSLQPAPPRAGTVVEVRNLFFNTPARRKFMKSAAAEVTAISEVLTRLALAHPEIAFSLDNHGRRSLELLPANDLQTRIGALFGKLTLLPVNYRSPHGLEITGFIAEPPESRAQSRFIYTFLNGRWFRHPGIARAVTDACAGNLPPRRYPFAVLEFTIDTTQVDVNAHPAKEVLRFENEQLIVGGASHAVRAALEARHFTVMGANDYAPAPAPETAAAALNASPVQEALSDYMQAHKFSAGRLADNGRGTYPPGGKFSSVSAKSAFPAPGGSRPAAKFFFSAAPRPSVTEDAPSALPQPRTEQLLNARQWRFLGQAGGKYLVLDTPEGVMLVDQHALHERWNYERLKNRPQTLICQQLLIPVEIALTPAESAAAEAALPVLREAGFTLELTGTAPETVLKITAYPEFISRRSLEQVCRDVLADNGEGGEKLPGGEFRDRLLARLACRSAVLFGTNLSMENCEDLLDKLLNNYLPSCPHGRPTKILLSWAELAGKFGR